MRIIKHWFLLSILISALGLTSCGSDSDDDEIIIDPTPTAIRKNPNVTLSTSVAPNSFSNKILIEDYTGTWCGWCPRVAHAMEEAIAKNSNIIGIGIHDDVNMRYIHVKNMLKKFNITGFPTAKINRDKRWSENFIDLQSSLSKKAEMGIALKTSENGNLVTGQIQMAFNTDITKSIDYVICLVESKVKYDQANYLNNEKGNYFYQKGNPIVDFEHTNVLRESATDIYGDIIPEDYTKKGKICEANFEINLDGFNKENCYIIAFVVEKGGKNVLNAQIVKVGLNKAFD